MFYNFFANKKAFVTRIFTYLFRKDSKVELGRWFINHNIDRINATVDLANEDHCGSCGTYLTQKKMLYQKEFR